MLNDWISGSRIYLPPLFHVSQRRIDVDTLSIQLSEWDLCRCVFWFRFNTAILMNDGDENRREFVVEWNGSFFWIAPNRMLGAIVIRGNSVQSVFIDNVSHRIYFYADFAIVSCTLVGNQSSSCCSHAIISMKMKMREGCKAKFSLTFQLLICHNWARQARKRQKAEEKL